VGDEPLAAFHDGGNTVAAQLSRPNSALSAEELVDLQAGRHKHHPYNHMNYWLVVSHIFCSP